MAKYSPKKAEECEEWIASHGLGEYGGAKMKDYYAAMGINEKSHRNWKKQHKEYAEAVERGKERFKADHTRILFGTLMEAAKGGVQIVENEHTEYRPNPDNPTQPIIRKQIRNKKRIYIQPNVAAAIFLICNLDPEHFQNRQNQSVTIKKEDTEEEMSLEEINAELERLELLEKSND